MTRETGRYAFQEREKHGQKEDVAETAPDTIFPKAPYLRPGIERVSSVLVWA